MDLKKHCTGQPDRLPKITAIMEAISFRLPRPVRKLVQYRDRQATYPICPRCSHAVDREYMNFCDRCGQRLNWTFLHTARVVIQSEPQTSPQSIQPD